MRRQLGSPECVHRLGYRCLCREAVNGLQRVRKAETDAALPQPAEIRRVRLGGGKRGFGTGGNRAYFEHA